MRLWQKISIVCIVVLLLVVTITGTLLLVSARSDILSLTVDNAKEKQASLSKAFGNMASLTVADDMPDGVIRAALLDCFAAFADDTSVLVHGFDTLYSYVRIEPQDILPVSTAEQRVFLDELGERNFCIVGSLVEIAPLHDAYTVYVISDISDVYQTYQNMTVRFIIIACAGITLGVLAIIFLVHRSTLPLKKLSQSAQRIAGGEYAERANIRTNDEVGALAEDFNRMAEAVQTHVDALEERNERQNLFISGVTHEFKTPMTSMMLHSETLLNNPLLTAEQREQSLMHIRTQCAWLERLTQKLMSLVTLGQDITLAKLPVSALFERVKESTHETLQKRGTPLLTECTADTLPMDADLMQSLLVNLVDNASKASEPGQTILLSGKGHVLTVTDHGRGIPPEAVKRVTEPFYMVDKSRSKRMGGSGLGLALVKRIADAHGATLLINSTSGEGTSVSVIFPKEAAL